MKQTATGRLTKNYATNWPAVLIAFYLLISAAPAMAQTDAGALNFDGSDDYVTIAHSSALSPTNVSLECWVNPSAGGVASTIITKEPNDGSHIGYGFRQRSNNTFGFVIGREGSGDMVTSITFTPGNWYHLAGTFDGSTINFYVNGALQGTASSSLSINSADNVNIGNNASLSQPFQGSIDEVRIWNTVKCQGEIQFRRYCQLTGSQAGLVAYYKFNQGVTRGDNSTVATLIDASGNSFNGTLNNFALNGRTSNWVAGNVVGACGTWIAPTATITTGGSTTICQGLPAALTANSGAGYTYQWIKDGTAVTGATMQTYAATAAGSYVVTIGGNCSTSSSTSVTVIPLTITAPADVTAYTNYGCSATAVSLGSPATGGRCYADNVYNDYPYAYFRVGATTVTWTVTDANGLTATATQTVTVIDNVNPTITAPANVTAYTNSGCSATGVSLGTPVTGDNCSVASVTNDNTLTSFPLGTTNVTWTVTDVSGNTATATQTVTVIDNINPTITAPANITVYANSGCSATGISLGAPATDDNCTVASVTNDHTSTTFPTGVTTVTWTVTDAGGNTSTATQTVTVIDNINPTITAPANVTAYATLRCRASGVSLGTPVTDDNCTVARVTNDHASTTFPIGTTTVTWTVTDGSGNTATATQTVTVTDNVNPTITAPANVTAYANSGCSATGVSLGTPATDDNCSVASVTNDHESTTFPTGATTVTWTVTDASGNTATATQTVTVIDNINPTVTAPANVTTYANSGCNATGVSLGAAATDDNCTVASVANDHASTTFPTGVTTVTWTVTDASGNTATASQTVTVIDNINPTITAPANVIAYATSRCSASAISLGTPATDDNCSVTSVTNDHASTSFPIGATTITWTVTDASGNTATATQTVTVVDNINPTITAPANVTAYTNSGSSATGISLGTPATDDNCTVANVTNDHGSTTFPAGATTVTWTVTDAGGNTATATQTVTVIDNINPTITAPANITVNNETGTNSATVATGTPATADNCSVASVTNNHPASSYPVGTTTITWTVTDASGNTATANQTITVNDAEAPHAICRNYTLVLSGGTGTVTADNINNGSYDNCGIASMTVYPNVFTCSQAGNHTVTLTVTDIHGNVSRGTSVVTVPSNPAGSVTVTPASGAYTGGVANNIYLGYGPQSAVLAANATGGSGFTYSWSPSTALSSSTAANPRFSPTSAGHCTYTVTATNSNGCSVSRTVSMHVVDAVDHCHSGKVILCHTPSGHHCGRQQLSVSVSAVDAHLSEHSDDHLGSCHSGCHSGEERQALQGSASTTPEVTQVFPNPSNGTFTILIPANQKDAIIVITDFSGRILETRSISENSGSPIEVSLTDATPGMYFVKVNAGEFSHVEKMVIR